MKIINLILKFFVLSKGIIILISEFSFARVSINKGHFLRGFLIGVVISVVVTILSFLGHFKPYVNPLTDLLQYITYKKANDVVLMFITDDDYNQVFHSTSPLSRKRLADIVDMLVKLEARVIALDIDISDPTPEDQILSNALDRASSAGVPVVAVASLEDIETTTSGSDSSLDLGPYLEETIQYTKGGFVLFKNATPGSQWINKVMYGGVVFCIDNDGIFRRAEAFYMIEDNDSQYTPVPSFPVAVAAAYQGMSQKNLISILSEHYASDISLSGERIHHQTDLHIHTAKGGRIIPNFIGNYTYFDREVNLTQLLKDYGPGRSAAVTVFKNKIVIVGGSYDKKDFYMTPVGRMSGMEILANITQNIISGNLITHASFWKAFIIEIVLAMIVALLFVFTSRFWATVICFVTVVPIVAIASLLSFSTSYYWFDFIPTIAGVLFHGWVKKAEEDVKVTKDKVKKLLKKKKQKTRKKSRGEKS